jgi:hypothetical protein
VGSKIMDCPKCKGTGFYTYINPMNDAFIYGCMDAGNTEEIEKFNDD